MGEAEQGIVETDLPPEQRAENFAQEVGSLNEPDPRPETLVVSTLVLPPNQIEVGVVIKRKDELDQPGFTRDEARTLTRQVMKLREEHQGRILKEWEPEEDEGGLIISMECIIGFGKKRNPFAEALMNLKASMDIDDTTSPSDN